MVPKEIVDRDSATYIACDIYLELIYPDTDCISHVWRWLLRRWRRRCVTGRLCLLCRLALVTSTKVRWARSCLVVHSVI